MLSVRCTSSTCKGTKCHRTVMVSKGVDKSNVKCYQHLNYVPASRKKQEPEPEMCPICFDEIRSKSERVKLCCKGGVGHVYHIDCIKGWFERDKDTCPMCRDKVPVETIKAIDPMFEARKADRLRTIMTIPVPGYGTFSIPRTAHLTDEEILMRIITSLVSHMNGDSV